MDLKTSQQIAAAGMRAQGTRLRVIAENLANANSTAPAPGEDPYRRQVVTFRNMMDRALGAESVEVNRVGRDNSDFQRRFEPSHPSADAEGYVLYPNVNVLVEMMDMREAQRSYEANLNALDAARSMIGQTIDLLRS
jgi:flagellar basal-body rod protein FlgC